MSKKISKKGFTLIELLVVISIIGLLSSIVLATLKSARSKARDGERVTEVRQLQKALELYFHEHGHYPPTTSISNGWIGSQNSSWDSILGVLVTGGFLPELPIDPINNYTGSTYPNTSQYAYTYFSKNYPSGTGDGKWYMLVFNLENDHSIEVGDGVYTCDASTSLHYGSPTNNIVTVGGNCVVTPI